MPLVSSGVQWRNWTHPRSSCLLLILSPAVPKLPKGFNPFSCPLLLSSMSSSLSSLPQFHREISSSSSEETGIPGQDLQGSWKAAQLCLSSPCPARSVDSLWELFPSNNSRVYLPLSASVGSRMCSQIWFMVLPALILSRLSRRFSLSKQVMSFQQDLGELGEIRAFTFFQTWSGWSVGVRIHFVEWGNPMGLYF